MLNVANIKEPATRQADESDVSHLPPAGDTILDSISMYSFHRLLVDETIFNSFEYRLIGKSGHENKNVAEKRTRDVDAFLMRTRVERNRENSREKEKGWERGVGRGVRETHQ